MQFSVLGHANLTEGVFDTIFVRERRSFAPKVLAVDALDPRASTIVETLKLMKFSVCRLRGVESFKRAVLFQQRLILVFEGVAC